MRRTAATVLLAMTLAGCGSLPNYGAAGSVSGQPLAATAAEASGFFWGVSTAGKQYEGGDTGSQWVKFEQAGKVPEPAGMAADGLQYYDTDAGLAHGMGLNAFRTSIEWSRIEPRPGYFDPNAVEYYHRFFASLRAHGLTPVVTLMHFSYPQWLDDEYGGWGGAQSVDQFAQYVDFVSREYAGQVNWWLTFNEPDIFVPGAYLTGNLAPGHHNPLEAMAVAKHFVQAHERAYTIIHQNEPDAHVSFNEYTAAYAIGSPEAAQPRTTQSLDLSDDNWMLDQVTSDSQGVGPLSLFHPGYLDFVAIDYYCKWQVKLPFPLTNDWSWDVYPKGFYNVLENYYHWFGLPVLVAENGIATDNLQPRTDGWNRSNFLVAHVLEMQKAMADGIPVLGYIHWSITDNWEWGSFSPRFGLYSVDCRDHDFRRVATPAVAVYKEIATHGGVTPDLIANNPPPPGTDL